MSTSTPLFKSFVQKSIESETQTSRVITTFTKFIKEKKGYYGAYLNDGKIHFHSGDYAIDFYIPAEMYQKPDRTIFRTLDEIGKANPTAKVIDELKKELNNDEIGVTKFHWFKNKSSTTKIVTFEKNHFIFPTEFYTGNVSLDNGTKDEKMIFESTKTILYKADKVAAPANVKQILESSIEKIKNAPFNINSLLSLRIAHENFFLYDSKNMVIETYVSKLNRNILSYKVISFLGKQADLENKLHLITLGQKLKFNAKKDFHKNKTEFELGKVHTKKSFNTL